MITYALIGAKKVAADFSTAGQFPEKHLIWVFVDIDFSGQ
jgi:hypothetical protein